MKKVLITAGALGMGGLENQLVYLGKHIDKNKFHVDYTSTDSNAYYKTDIIKAGCGFCVLPDPRKDGTIKYCWQLYNLIKHGGYDVVHSQELFHSGIEMFIAWVAKVPKRIAHSHSTQDGSNHNSGFKTVYHWIMRRSILMFATDYLACSTIAGKYLYGNRITRNKRFRVVVNSVETQSFFSETYPVIWERKKGWKYIVHVGRFVDVKNHDFMLDLACQMKQEGKKICFVFVGDGELMEHCKERVKKEKLNQYVLFLGQRRNVEDILREADAFILPSHYEGMPLSLIEAQTAGLPCLIADHITEEADFGINLIFRKSLSDGIDKWINGLEQLVAEEHPSRNQIREAIHKKGFDVSDFQRTMCEIYED